MAVPAATASMAASLLCEIVISLMISSTISAPCRGRGRAQEGKGKHIGASLADRGPHDNRNDSEMTAASAKLCRNCLQPVRHFAVKSQKSNFWIPHACYCRP
jgi:hypothetical protein